MGWEYIQPNDNIFREFSRRPASELGGYPNLQQLFATQAILKLTNSINSLRAFCALEWEPRLQRKDHFCKGKNDGEFRYVKYPRTCFFMTLRVLRHVFP